MKVYVPDKEEFIDLLAQILQELDQNSSIIRARLNYPNDSDSYN